MQDYYLKDIKILQIILALVIIGVIVLVNYSYYKSNDSGKYALNIVYASGNNTYRFGQNYEYKFDVIGYNNTNDDIVYNLYAYNGSLQTGNRLDDNRMFMLLKEKDQVINGPIVPFNMDKGMYIGQFVIPKQSGNYLKEFELILGINNENYGDIIDDQLNYYNVNVKLFLVK